MSFTTLENWRNSRAGTLLFYGYLVAVLIAGIMAFTAYQRSVSADAKLRHEIALGLSRDARSCHAIAGATELWAEELKAARLLANDTTLPASIRVANAARAQALSAVLEKAGHTPSCGGVS